MFSTVQLILLLVVAVYLYQNIGIPVTYLSAGILALVVTTFVIKLLQSILSKSLLYGGITALVSQLTGLSVHTSLYLTVAGFLTVFIYQYFKHRP